jgi:hypothetical protein
MSQGYSFTFLQFYSFTVLLFYSFMGLQLYGIAGSTDFLSIYSFTVFGRSWIARWHILLVISPTTSASISKNTLKGKRVLPLYNFTYLQFYGFTD